MIKSVIEPGRAYVRSFCCLGGGQFFLGIVSISVDVSFYILLYTQQSSEFDGVEYIKNLSGIWAGVFFLLAGIFSMCTSCFAGSCRVNGTLIFSAVSAIMAPAVITLESLLASEVKSIELQPHEAVAKIASQDQLKSAVFGLHVALAVMGLFEFILAVATSVICCVSMCCRKETPSYISTRSKPHRQRSTAKPFTHLSTPSPTTVNVTQTVAPPQTAYGSPSQHAPPFNPIVTAVPPAVPTTPDTVNNYYLSKYDFSMNPLTTSIPANEEQLPFMLPGSSSLTPLPLTYHADSWDAANGFDPLLDFV